MKILFIHQNFPGQFRALSNALATKGHEVRAIAITGKEVPGVDVQNYIVQRGSSKNIHPLVTDFETKIIRGEACANALEKLKKEGYAPDLVIAHSGWGETAFLKDIFPDVKFCNYFEFYYKVGTDTHFDPEFSRDSSLSRMRLRTKNASHLLALESMDIALCPTNWQASTAPEIYKSKIKVVFDGIDTDIVKPNLDASLTIKKQNGATFNFTKNDEIITFVNRQLEPYRGYHSFIRSLPKILKTRPQAKVLIVGGDKVSYGAQAPDGKTWKHIFYDEIKDQVDESRIFFLGNISYDAYLSLIQISSVHVYLTYPFVLSWSCLEALSVGLVVVGSKTPPVEEVINHKKNGILVDFFNYAEISNAVIHVLENPNEYENIRQAARKTIIDKYNLKTVCLPKQIEIIESILI